MIIRVMPIWEFQDNADKYTKILSITEPDRYIKSLGEHHLVLSMWDIDKVFKNKYREYLPPSEEEVFKGIEFAKTWKEDDVILIHCAAGISRSPAMAYGLVWNLTKDIEKTNEILAHMQNRCQPNKAIMDIWRKNLEGFPF